MDLKYYIYIYRYTFIYLDMNGYIGVLYFVFNIQIDRNGREVSFSNFYYLVQSNFLQNDELFIYH